MRDTAGKQALDFKIWLMDGMTPFAMAHELSEEEINNVVEAVELEGYKTMRAAWGFADNMTMSKFLGECEARRADWNKNA